MIRSKLLSVALIVSACSAQAGLIKDTGRVTIGAASGAGLHVAASAALEFWNKGTDFKWQEGVDLRFTPVWATIGAVCALPYTSYGRVAWAQWMMSSQSSRLVTIVKTDYENDAALVKAIERCFLSNTYPLVAAKKGIAAMLVTVGSAADEIQNVLDEINANSDRACTLNQWLNEIYLFQERIVKAAAAVEADPRLEKMLEAQNKKDEADAAQKAATAKMINALLGNRHYVTVR